MNINNLIDFLEPVNRFHLSDDQGYTDAQIGSHIGFYEDALPDINDFDCVLVGCNEVRGSGVTGSSFNTTNNIRKQLYNLFYWHNSVKLVDIGDIKVGASVQDSYAAIKTVVKELLGLSKRVIIFGGSHDVMIAQYQAYGELKNFFEVACIDAKIDLDNSSLFPADNFLMTIFTSEPNFINHYNHIGFQSFFVHSKMLETIGKLGFDCYRVGKVKENLEEIEPAIRNTNLISFDISAIQNAHAPANRLTPNGFTGEEACTLTQYAGMSTTFNTLGIHGYNPSLDIHNMTAKQIAQMIWYYVDGIYKGQGEDLHFNKNNFNEYNVTFAEISTTFLQSKYTNRWWMKLPNGTFTACSKLDYVMASHNEIPERWLRYVERQ